MAQLDESEVPYLMVVDLDNCNTLDWISKGAQSGSTLSYITRLLDPEFSYTSFIITIAIRKRYQTGI